jgi:hypothetical protein
VDQCATALPSFVSRLAQYLPRVAGVVKPGSIFRRQSRCLRSKEIRHRSGRPSTDRVMPGRDISYRVPQILDVSGLRVTRVKAILEYARDGTNGEDLDAQLARPPNAA